MITEKTNNVSHPKQQRRNLLDHRGSNLSESENQIS